MNEERRKSFWSESGGVDASSRSTIAIEGLTLASQLFTEPWDSWARLVSEERHVVIIRAALPSPVETVNRRLVRHEARLQAIQSPYGEQNHPCCVCGDTEGQRIRIMVPSNSTSLLFSALSRAHITLILPPGAAGAQTGSRRDKVVGGQEGRKEHISR